MRIVIASCSAIYTGRGDTKLHQAVRAILFKEDGSISIHNDKGNKPLNYMGKGNIFSETFTDSGLKLWNFDTSKESLQIVIHELISDTSFELVLEDDGLVRDGTEKQLQDWLALHPESLGEGFTLVGKEYPTGAGPVDLLVKDKEGHPIAVEIKRVAMLGTVGQILRYVTALKEQDGFENIRGMIAAVDIRPKTLVLAGKRDIECVDLPDDWNRQKLPTYNI